MSDLLSAPEVATLARARLEKVVTEGVQRTSAIVERVMNDVPQDRIMRGDKLGFSVGERVVTLLGSEVSMPLHAHAFGQLTERAGIPGQYARSLLDPAPWRQALLQHMLEEHYKNQGGRYLVRSSAGQVRGFLSDRFRRLDSRPLLDSFIGGCKAIGAVPYEGVANEVRTSVRAIIPTIHEPVPGEAMVLGLSWTNSDYGAGTYEISAFVMRLVCLNGAVGESQLRQVHLGKQLPDNVEFSDATYALDTKTMVSATADIVRHAIGPAAVERRLGAIKAAHEGETDWRKAFAKVGAALTKKEAEAAKEAFEGPESIMLPPGKTLWRASNALSWIANKTDDAERKLELQQAAGKILAA